MKEQFPIVATWIERMLNPGAEGEFESWASLSDTLFPIIKEQIGSVFLPWSDANSKALENDDESFSISLKGSTFSQKPQKYHKKSLATLRERYKRYSGNKELAQLLSATGCLEYLQ